MSEKDKQKLQQLLMKLHDEGKIDTRKLLEELGMDYDEEVKRMDDVAGESDDRI